MFPCLHCPTPSNGECRYYNICTKVTDYHKRESEPGVFNANSSLMK